MPIWNLTVLVSISEKDKVKIVSLHALPRLLHAASLRLLPRSLHFPSGSWRSRSKSYSTVPTLTVTGTGTLFSEQRLDANVCWQVLIVDGPGGGAFGLGAVSEVVEPLLELDLQIQGLGFSDCLGGGF